MSAEQLKRVLERVAGEVAYGNADDAFVVLERRLLPLLLAGQAMRELFPDKPMVTSPIDWDAAIKEALKQ